MKTDTLTIDVAAAYSPSITLSASDSNIICGDTVQMNLNIDEGVPPICGPSNSVVCQSPPVQNIIGSSNGSNGATTWPAPFGNWYRNAKHQFLFTASELQSSGFTGGKITEIAWETLDSNNATSIFNDYTIRMGCTNSTDLSSWETGLTTVFSPQNINVIIGWNNFVFTTAYEWDGISNLVIEICYDNLSFPYTQNWSSTFSTTSFNSSYYYYNDINPACPNLNLSTASNLRPLTQFTMCSTTPDPTAFEYNWTPNLFISNDTIQNPVVFPDVSTLYQVVATDTNGGCTDTATILINVNCCYNPIINLNDISCFGMNNGSIDVLPQGDSLPPWDIELLDAITGNLIQSQSIISGTALFNNLLPGNYIVTTTDSAGCFTDTLLTISEPNQLIINTTIDTAICLNDILPITTTGANFYTWNTLNGLSDSTIANPIASPLTTITYYVTGLDSSGCSDSDSITITVNDLPTATVSNDTIICFGDTTQLVSSGGTNYTWSPADSLSSTVISDPLAWPTVTTNYQVIISDNNGCLDTAQVNIGVSNLPNVDAGSDVDICFGDTIQLTASGAATYSWSPADSLDNTGISNPLAWPSDTTQYIVTGFNALGCLFTDTMFVNVNPLPLADAGPDEWICPGDNIQLSASGGAVYLWTPATDLSNPNIPDPVATLIDTATYQVQVTSSEGCIEFDTITIFVNPNVPTDAGADTTICIGDSIQIGGNPTAVNGTAYLWSPAGFVDDPTIANPIAFPTTPTTFYVVTSNDTCTGIDSIFIGVNPDPPIDAGADIQICLGDTAQLGATGGISFVWTPIESAPGDTILSNDTIADPLAYPTDTTLFFVTIEDLNGCIDTDSMTVVVNPPPTIDAGSGAGICIGDSIQLGAVGGDTYVWTPADSISDVNVSDPIVWPTDTTEYFVTVTDSNSCVNIDSVTITVHPLPIVSAGIDDTICIGETTQLIGTGALTYLWSPNDSISDNTVAFPFVWPTDTTDYIVVGTDANGCVESDTVNILVIPLPIVTASSDVQICIGDSTQLSATGADSYVWTPNGSLVNAVVQDPIALPTDTTEYIVQGVDLNGCINTDTVIVTVNPLPNADAGFNVNICEGDNVLLGATGGESYLWSPSPYLNHDTVADPLAFPDTSMMFYVQVTDSNGCIAGDSLYVTVFMIYTVEDQIICLGDSVQLNVFGEPAVSFSWSPATGLSDPNIIDPWATPSSTTTYTVTATDSQGCTDQDDATVIISSDPASFNTEVVGGCEGAVATFTNTSDPALDFIWNFSDGDTSTLEEVDHVYTFGEDFSATLTVTNALGCMDTSSFYGSALNFEDYYDIQIPNVFTPNGDGQNDHFVVEVPGRIYECVDLKIYNRWGQILFISTGNNLKWDGRTNVGEKVPSGTYFYTINVKDQYYKGSLNVFR